MHPLDQNVWSLQYDTVADPGAATQFVWSCPINSRVLIHAVRFRVTAVGGGAGRLPVITVTDGAQELYSAVSGNVITAGIFTDVNFTRQAGTVSGTITLKHVGEPLGSDFYLEPGYTLKSEIMNLNLADTITGIVIAYRQYILGAT